MGDGRSIGVFNDPWIPRPYSFKAVTIPPASARHLKVSHLLDSHSGMWHVAALHEHLWPIDVELVTSILINSLGISIFEVCSQFVPVIGRFLISLRRVPLRMGSHLLSGGLFCRIYLCLIKSSFS